MRIGGIHARLADGAALALELSGAERIRPVEELRQVLDRVFVEVVNGLLDAEFFDLVCGSILARIFCRKTAKICHVGGFDADCDKRHKTAVMPPSRMPRLSDQMSGN